MPLALLAFVAFLVGFIVSKAVQHPSGADFWLFIGLMLISLHLALGPWLTRYYPGSTRRTTAAPGTRVVP